MSYWVQVSGQIRCNYKLQKEVIKKLRRELGTPTTYKQRNKGDIPYGSEGSIQYTITKIKNNSGKYQTCVIISGALRDRSSEEFVESIRDWFKKVVYNRDFCVDEFRLDIGSAQGYEVITYCDADSEIYDKMYCEVCGEQLRGQDYWDCNYLCSKHKVEE